MPKLFKKFQKRLTNLTSRNRSLVLLGLPQEYFFDLQNLDFLDSKPAFSTIEQLISGKNAFPVLDVLDPRHEKVNETSKQLRRIAQTEKFIAEERGAKELFVAYPFVQGKFSDGTVVRCPLLFWAVSLKQESGKWVIEKREEIPTLNQSFLLAYSHFNQVRLDDELLEQSFGEFDKNALVFRTQLYEWLKNSPLKINFNSELFENKLHWFDRLSKTDVDNNERNGELKCLPLAILGIFPQAGSYLYQDYEHLLEQENEMPEADEALSKLFFDKCVETRTTEPILTPLRVDAFQENALTLVRTGKSMVVQGPPGTGKSQFIANLIADFTARGKKVLLVCQKRVALDTVYQRLGNIGANPFLALVHDFRGDRKMLFQQIATQIEQIEAYKKQNYSLDAIVLERNFVQTSRRIEQIVRELDDLKQALFDDSICGLSPKELYLTSNPKAPHADFGQCFRDFHFDTVHEFEATLRRFCKYEIRLSTYKAYIFWRERKSFAGYDFTDVSKILDNIRSVKPAFDLDFAGHLGLLQEIPELENLNQLIEKQEVKEIFESQKDYLNKIKSKQWATWQKTITENIEPLELFGLSLENAMTLTQDALLANGGFWAWQKWQFSAEKNTIEKLLHANTAEQLHLSRFTRESWKSALENLLHRLQKRQQVLLNLININQSGLTISYSEDLLNVIENHRKALKATEIERGLMRIIPEISVQERYQRTKKFILDLQQWRFYLTDQQIEQLFQGYNFSPDFLKDNFDNLVEMDKLNTQQLSTIHNLLANQAALHSEMPDYLALFSNSLRLAWLSHLEEQNPILRAVSSLKIEQLEEELQTAIQQKQAWSEAIFLMRLREQTYQSLEKNRLGNTLTYRDLYHQSTKKRQLWSIRKLLEQHFEEIFRLIPCWLASPEAVSALFPMQENVFDLVIFDEASQCFIENALPAIFRGKQMVVAGDSQQLQPNDLYQIRYEDSEMEEVLLEIDSLLDMATQFLPQTMLQEHYRSRSLDLIGFSNQHFYKNRLQLLPHFQEINASKPAIEYRRVQGVWQHNRNETEAQEVYNLVREIQQKNPEKSIGIVTFNHTQARLIQDLLPESPNVTVKNIENIQGDEFDVVIFSVAYAPDSKGKFLMQFGSLNQQGGENRLNVAITRAKERIVLVCSILPEQLQVEQHQNVGAKMLKAYLEYAWEISSGQYRPSIQTEEKRNATWLLKNKLCEENIGWIEELPFADITVKENIQYQSLVLTDDEHYHRSLSAKAFFGYFPLSLREKGWKFERQWSRNWWKTVTSVNKKIPNVEP